jgi:hypothetical protein
MHAQNMSGLVNDNHGGISNLLINPASIADSKLWLDINVLTLNTYAENNFLYIPASDYRFKHFFLAEADWEGEDGRLFSDYYGKNRQWNFYTQILTQLPSVMYNVGEHGFAYHSTLRQHFSANSVDNPMSKFISEGLSYNPQQNIPYKSEKIDIRQAIWLETGFTYARTWKTQIRRQWSAGMTIKKTLAMSGVFLTTENMNYIVLNDSTFYSPSTEINFGYAPLGSQLIGLDNSIGSGGGWSADFGLVFQKKADVRTNNFFKTPCRQIFEDYIYKIGVSFIDIGYIRFSENAIRYNSSNTQVYWENIDTYNFDGFDKFSEDLLARSVPPAQIESTSFSIFLPAAMSLQFDYNIESEWFINSTLIQPLPLGEIRLTSPSVFLISPRYESRYYGVSIPFVLYEWYKPRMGLSIRIFNFTIGTDYLNTILGLRDFSGLDLYVALKISFAKGYCRGSFTDFFKGMRYYNRACP